MKKNLIYILVIILACALTGTITYIFVDKQSDKTEIKDNEPSNKENENEKTEQITLSKSELKEYLNYVPVEYDNNMKNAYKQNFITIDSINKELLLYNALHIAYIHYENYFTRNNYNTQLSYNGFMQEEKIDTLLKQAYNLSLNDFTLNSSETNAILESSFDGMCFYYFNKGFADVECSEGSNMIFNINEYVANKDELIIYANSVIPWFEGIIEDAHTGKQVDIIYNQNSDITFEEIAKKYIKTHETEFTKFKHTFKKNDTGYYWYKTEVVK